YTLNSDSDINIWLDKLKSELSSKDLLDVIDPTVIGPDNLDVQTITKRKQAVREIITSHLDDKYYKRVLTITDPIMVITSLKEAKRVEKNVTHTSVRTKLYGMRLKPKESIDEFWNKFDNTIVEYESCDNAVPLTDEEKRSAFYQAVSKVIPEARTADLLHRQFKGRSMTLVELRSHLLQLEAEKKSETSQEQDAWANQAKRFKSHHDNCYRCNKTGHYVKQCPLAATSEWYCYICKVITDHNTNSYNITFIADSGATEHIINKSLILSNFKHCTGEVIKSANKNKSADIVIDGVGDLYLKSNLSKIKLTNVLSAENIANNLISLRRFVDAGLGIFLDDKKLEIFDKETGETCLTGKYVKPNWLVTFEVKHAEEVNRPDYTTYSCTAEIISPNESSEQSQTVPVDLNLQKMEGDLDVFSHKSTSSELGRESQKKSLLEKNSSNIEAEITDFLLDEQTLNRRILNFNSADALEEFNNIKSAENNIQQLKIIKIDEGMLWHIRLGHPSLNYLKELKKSEQSLCNVNFKENILDCETCILVKMEKLPFKESRLIADRPLHTIHVDTMGQFKINSFPGAYKYIIVFLDDFSRFAKIYSIKNKNEAASCLESFINTTRNLLGKNEKVCYIRTDNAREFTGGDFVDVMHKEKIESDYAPPYTPELNGTAERFNKTIQQKIRALLFDSGLPKSMWILAAETAVNMYNRTPHKTNGFISPLNKLNEKISTHMNKIRRFGCLAYVKLPISENKFSE
ncbi:GSCOCG00011254001-RA-CDS, partial [Cotesia congregata]